MKYYGTKLIEAWHESKDGEPGYGVKYADDYVSWSPKNAFEAAYQPLDAMNFGHALAALKDGHRVAREGWNGKGMFLFFVQGSTFEVSRPPLMGIYPEGHVIRYQSHVDMMTAQGTVVPWLCSQSDLLSQDWCIVSSCDSKDS